MGPWLAGWSWLHVFYPSHHNVMAWRRFPHYWSFVRGIHRWPVDSPHKGPVMWSFDSFVVRPIKLSSKQSICLWLGMPRRPCDVTVTRPHLRWMPCINTIITCNTWCLRCFTQCFSCNYHTWFCFVSIDIPVIDLKVLFHWHSIYNILVFLI